MQAGTRKSQERERERESRRNRCEWCASVAGEGTLREMKGLKGVSWEKEFGREESNLFTRTSWGVEWRDDDRRREKSTI